MEVEIRPSVNRKRPQVLTYLSISAYLRDYYEFRRTVDTKFSYEIWAAEIGFKSRSTLRNICYGVRNVSEMVTQKFSKFEKLSEAESQYLLVLAKLQNADNPSLKGIYLDRVAELTDLSFKSRELNPSTKFLTDPLLLRLHMVISFSDFESSEKNLLRILTVSPAELEAGLRCLLSLGLIKRRPAREIAEPQYFSTAKYFQITDEQHDEAIKIFHRNTLKEADRILTTDLPDQKFKSLLFSLSASDFEAISRDVDLFCNKLKVKYGNKLIKNKKLFKINLHAYPVTIKDE